MTGSNVFAGAPSSISAKHLPALPTGWHALHYRALADGGLVVVTADVDFMAEWTRIFAADGPVDPPSRILEMSAAGTARLLVWRDGVWGDGPRFPLEFAHPTVDRFADGRWLVVGTRTENKPNARVLSPDGTLIARFMLGDGIEHAAIDRVGRIWVGWFDEGIFGNTEWHVPGEEWPPSSRGVGCFEATGKILRLPDFPPVLGMIDDCYALTPVSDGAWVCPYADFPLIHVRLDQPVRWWANDLAGPKALAVDGSHALVAGGYREDANRLALISLDGAGQGESARLLAQWPLPLRRMPGSPNDHVHVWDSPALLAGYGDTLHLIDDDVWHRWRVADVLADLEQ